MRPRIRPLLCLLVIWLAGTLGLGARAKTDVAVLENGDTITGGIKCFQREILSLKTETLCRSPSVVCI